MLRRVLALMLTIAAMSAPLALVLCHAECGEAAAGRDQAAHHSCHASGDESAVSMSAVPHLCGHDGDAPAGVERAPIVVAPLAVLSAWMWSPSSAGADVAAASTPDISPPDPQRLIQLRV